jgi:hypothetical protein
LRSKPAWIKGFGIAVDVGVFEKCALPCHGGAFLIWRRSLLATSAAQDGQVFRGSPPWFPQGGGLVLAGLTREYAGSRRPPCLGQLGEKPLDTF